MDISKLVISNKNQVTAVNVSWMATDKAGDQSRVDTFEEADFICVFAEERCKEFDELIDCVGEQDFHLRGLKSKYNRKVTLAAAEEYADKLAAHFGGVIWEWV